MELFGKMPDGTGVERITLRGGGLSCRVITYGGALQKLCVPDGDGGWVDVVLGFDRLEDYFAQTAYIGALVGRYANRIGGARFALGGQEWPLAANEGRNQLHGGPVGFDKRVWSVEAAGEDFVTLSLVSAHGEGGFPGEMTARVTYTLSNGALILDYEAVCDRETLCNLTSHAYFNLGGHDSGSICGHTLRLNASAYVPTDGESIPLGRLEPVEGTPMDFREETPIGLRIGEDHPQLALAAGYDHNWAIDGAWGSLRPAARAVCPETGIVMEMSTTLPGVQLYTGNWIGGVPAGKGGAVYENRHAFCLESQFYPDSPNWPEVPQAILRPGEVWKHRTVFAFSNIKKSGC